MDGAGRTILRDARRGTEQQPLVANLMKPIVDDFVALTGQMPDTKVPYPEDQSFADMMEKFHYGVQHASNMRLHAKAMGWFNSAMGACAGLVWPNFTRRHAMQRIVGPDKVFGVPDLMDEFAFSSAVIIESYSAKQILDYFPNKKIRTFVEDQSRRRATWWGESGRVEIIRWFDKTENVTILGREVQKIRDDRGRFTGAALEIEPLVEAGRVEHGLGVCTVVPFQNFLLPGEWRSISDIEEAVGLNQWLNFLLNSHEEGIRQELFAPLVVIDPQKAPEDIDTGDPMAIIPVNKGGDVKRLPGPTGAQQVMQGELSRGQGLIEYVTGTSATRTQGKQPGSAIATGRSLDKGQGPLMSRIEMRNELNAVSFEHMNSISALMTTQLFERDTIELFGTRSRGGGSMFKMRIEGRDLQGYGYNVVTYPPSMYMGMEQRIVAMEQLIGGKHQMVSRRTAMEFVGLVDHPDEELAAIERDQLAELDFQKRLQGAQGAGDAQGPSPMEQSVSMAAGSAKPAALGVLPVRGAAGATGAASGGPAGGASSGGPAAPKPSAALPAGPPPPPQEKPQSGIGGSLAAQVETAITAAAPKGQVFIVDKGAKVEVLAQTRQDVMKLRNKVWKFFDRAVVTIKQMPKTLPPGAREVGGGAGGSPQGQEAQQGQPQDQLPGA